MFDDFRKKEMFLQEAKQQLKRELCFFYDLNINLHYELVEFYHFDKDQKLLFIFSSKEDYSSSRIDEGFYDAFDISFIEEKKDCNIFTGLYSCEDPGYTYFLCKKTGELK